MSNATERIKQGLKAYGHMLKNTYIPSHKKKKIRQTMASMQRELKRLQKEEQLETLRYKIAKKQQNISKLRGQTGGGSAYKRFENMILKDSPDYWGQMGRQSRKRGPFDVI